MKKINALMILMLLVTVILARSSYTGYTRKTRTTGCSCHGSSANSSVTVAITGPAQITAGASATYQVSISGGSGTQVSINIAASSGTLAPSDAALVLSGGELISNGTKTYTNGTYTYSFNYTAPSTAGNQTLYATGLPSRGTGWNFAPDKTVTVVSATGVEENFLPRSFSLEQNYPNPFNPSTTISYSLPENSVALIKVYDILGKEIATLVNGEKTAGSYKVKFDASHLSSGIYLYSLKTKSFSQTRKMFLLK